MNNCIILCTSKNDNCDKTFWNHNSSKNGKCWKNFQGKLLQKFKRETFVKLKI